ncbi:ComF family protein [bacterium]|nr:ComF family protein [bacterium]
MNSTAVSVDRNRTLKMIAREFYHGLTSLLFPAICIVCDQRIDEPNTVVCHNCWSDLKVLSTDIVKMKQIPEQLDTILPVFEFNDTIQKIIHGLKYSGYKSSGVHLGRLMAAQLPQDFLVKDTVLMPVPLHPLKKRERGYNQSMYIARGIAEISGNIIRDNVLNRVKNTVTQTHLDAHERHANMQNAFAVNRSCDLSGIYSIVLIDDVFTTGATMNAAATVLKSRGVASIRGLTVAAPI